MIIFRILAILSLIALVIYQSLVIRRLSKDLKSTKDSLAEANNSFDTLNSRHTELKETLTKQTIESLDRQDVEYKEFGVAEDERWCKFNIYMQGQHGKYTIKTVWFDHNDPDDREYKRIHAEEVAEMLNEKP